MTFADACRTAFWLLLAGRDLRVRADRDWIRAREAEQAPALPPSDAGMAGHRPLEGHLPPPPPSPEPLTARQFQAGQQEAAFRVTHPDYDAVLARAGIWQVVTLCSRGVPLTLKQQLMIAVIRAAPHPAEAAYGLALTRIATGEVEEP